MRDQNIDKRAERKLGKQRGGAIVQTQWSAPTIFGRVVIMFSLLSLLLTISPLFAEQTQYPIRLTAPAKRYILIEEGKRTSYYEITNREPMMVEMKGPMTVVIEMRLNLDAYSPIIPDLVELTIERDEETYDVYRVTPKGVSEERYEGIQDIIPSTKTGVRIDVPPGNHSYVLSISASATLGATLKFTIPGARITKKPEPEKKLKTKPAPEKPQAIPPPEKPAPKPAVKKEEEKNLAVFPFFNPGMTVETYSNLGFYLRAGAGLDTMISDPFGFTFVLAGAYYQTKYYRFNPEQFSLENPSVTEMRVDFTPLLTYTAYGKKFSRISVEPSLGVRAMYFSASDFSKIFLGPIAGIRFTAPLFKTLAIQGMLGGAYGLIDSKSNEAVTGNPKIDAIGNIAIRIPLDHSYILRVGFDGELMGYPRTRIVQGNNTIDLKNNIRVYSGAFAGMEF